MGRLLACAVLLAAGPPVRLSAQHIPPPAAILGFEPGADSMLATWAQVSGYMNRLAQASPAVRVDTLGRTTEGRPFQLVVITSPANQARLAQIKRAQRLLADPRRLDEATYDSLRGAQPAVVLIGNNIHSDEIASSLMGPVLAHRLATDRALAPLLDSVVVLLLPSTNPDGLDTVVAWYRRYKGTRYEGGPLPWLYHKYVGHDNNRDWFMVTQAETQLVTRVLYHEWFPLAVYDVHQMGDSGPRFFVPPMADPVNPNLDPAIVAGISAVGAQMAADLYAAGKRGIVHQYSFDLWWHGGFRSTPTRHNMIGIISEAASARLASPIGLRPSDVEQPPRGVNHPGPWPGGLWGLHDIIEYELIAATSLIRLAARERAAWIERFVSLGRRATEAGRREPPFAYLLPPEQRDPGAWAALANVLLAGGIEIARAEAAFTADGVRYSAGTLVVPLAQPFRAHAKDLLERQRFPEGLEPYDVTGWTLPYSMGVRVVAAREAFTAPLVRVDTVVPVPGRIEGSGDVFILKNRANRESTAIAALLTAGQSVWALGDSVVARGPRARQILAEHAARYGLAVVAVRSAPRAAQARRRMPRIALYQPWTENMDEGWTRWLFEQYGITYTTVHDSDLRQGRLRSRFDVIVLPDERPERLLRGLDSTRIPLQYAGGMAEDGARALSAFVRDGGTLVCLDSSSDFAISRLNLPVVNVLAGEASGPEVSRFYAPGSIFGVALGGPPGASPVTIGVRDSFTVYFAASGAFSVQAPARALALYPSDPLRSGYARHTDRVVGKAALVEAPVGRGRVILFGFRPQFRGQTHGTFKLLFNAVLLAAPAAP